MFNPNFNNFQGNWFTFQHMQIPPPPLPPPYIIPPVHVNPVVPDDANVLKYYESRLPTKQQKPEAPITISVIKDQLKDVLVLLKNINTQEKDLQENINSLSDEAWSAKLEVVLDLKKQLNEIMASVNQADFGVLKKLIVKRSAKRTRLKRLKADVKVQKEQQRKDSEEKSRKIDDYLKKVKDDIDKVKQDEKAKTLADTVLKDVLRKKQDAKKCLVKLDALIKLRKAKMNTAKGRGEKVSEHEATAFNNNIEKLKLLWKAKLNLYEKEELELRGTLEQKDEIQQAEPQVASSLQHWRDIMFGGEDPQRNFNGDIAKFIEVRCDWDALLSSEGATLPVGWVPPQAT